LDNVFIYEEDLNFVTPKLVNWALLAAGWGRGQSLHVLKLEPGFFCRLTNFISSYLMKLDFISQSPSKFTLPFAGLQHMQQCQLNFHSIFAPDF
jgi:hypothetical protein